MVHHRNRVDRKSARDAFEDVLLAARVAARAKNIPDLDPVYQALNEAQRTVKSVSSHLDKLRNELDKAGEAISEFSE